MRLRIVHAAMLLVALVVIAPQLAGAQGQTPAVVARDYYFEAPDGSRTPASVTIAAGGGVSFAYPTGLSSHNVHFTSAPAAPSCAGSTAASQPAFDSPGHTATPQGPGWSGTCTFTSAGDYKYLCTLHPSVMYGVVHVTGAPSTGSGTANAPGAGTAVSNVAIAAAQRGAAVNGAVTLGIAGSRLEIDVYVAHSLLAVAHSVLVGSSVATGAPAGKHVFSIALNSAARSALRRHRYLAVKVKVSVTPPGQSTTLVTRRVTLRG